jgi:hypothetical protein
VGIVWELFGNCLGLSFPDYQLLNIVWWELFGNCLGISWEFRGNLVGSSWEFRGKKNQPVGLLCKNIICSLIIQMFVD